MEDFLLAPCRLIVLVPDQVSDESKLAHKIAALALPYHLKVLFLEVIESAHQELAAYLQLARLSTLVGAFSLESETRLVSGGNWVREVKEVWQAGDQIVCPTEQMIIGEEMNQVHLSTTLSIALNTPIILLTENSTEMQPHRHSLLSKLRWWGGALIILMVMVMIMLLISQTASGLVNSVLLFSAFLISILMIWFWNKH